MYDVIYITFKCITENIIIYTGCVDFVPARTKVDGVFSTGDFEPLATVMTRAHQWIRQNPGLNITNVNSCDYKLKTDEGINVTVHI